MADEKQPDAPKPVIPGQIVKVEITRDMVSGYVEVTGPINEFNLCLNMFFEATRIIHEHNLNKSSKIILPAAPRLPLSVA